MFIKCVKAASLTLGFLQVFGRRILLTHVSRNRRKFSTKWPCSSRVGSV